MNPQSSNHSSGPRSSRQRGNPFSGRSRNRGGIQKRNATPTRIDKDGDAVMDSASVRGGRGTSVRGSAQNRRHGTPDTLQARVSGRLNKIGIDPTSIEKAVLRGVSSKDPSRDSKFSARLPRNDGLDTLRVWGLKESRAISNPDGGLKDLLAFLERKATHPDSPAVKIKKVCLTLQSAGRHQSRSSRLSGPLSFQAKFSKRRPRDVKAIPGRLAKRIAGSAAPY